jgi:uncharacterized protein YjiS (DUF1127 family)
VQRRVVSVIASAVVVASIASGCTQTADTTTVDVVDLPEGQAAPTSTIMEAERTTTTTVAPSTRSVGAATDPTAALTQLLVQLASDPAVAAQLAQLQQLDAAGVAELLGIDAAALADLGLTPAQLEQLARGVAVSPPPVQQDLAGGNPDAAVLLGLLAGSLDLESLANGTLATIVADLLATTTGATVEVDPRLSADLGQLLAAVDPEGLGPLAANPANAELLSLITSAWIGSDSQLAQQLRSSPVVVGPVRELLDQLLALNASLNGAARAALLTALYQLAPDLAPRR